MGLDVDRLSMNFDEGRHRGGTNERAPKTAVLVLGMHRSGTSSVAGALVSLGGVAPLHLLPSHGDKWKGDNERGFWESSVLVALNDEILAAGGSNWQDWRAFDLGRIDASSVVALRARAKTALASEFGDDDLPIIKDPRMCRLMRFWAPVFEEAECSVRAVLPLRSPLEVAWSLNRRDGVSLSCGCLLWLRHVLDAEAETRGRARAVLDWQSFLHDRRSSLERAGEQLGLTWPHSRESDFAKIDEYISPDLRHHTANDNDLRAHPAINDLVRETNAAMIELVKDPTDSRTQRRLDDARARFDDAAAIFEHPVFELQEESHRYATRVAVERENFASQLAAERDQFASQLAAERDQFASQLAAERENFASQLAERDQFASQLAAERENFASRLEKLQYDYDGQSDRISLLQNNCDKLESALTHAEKLIADVSERYQSLSRKRLTKTLRRRIKFALSRPPVRHTLYEAISNSIFFDKHFYVNSNPDVAAARVDPVVHYLLFGSKEGRAPSRFFSESEYLYRHPDVGASGVPAIQHYEGPGRAEGRRILSNGAALDEARSQAWRALNPTGATRRAIDSHGLFHEAFYRVQASDVGRDAIGHYLETGRSLGLWPHPLFEPTWYLERYVDVREARIDPFLHFLQAGGQEGRWPNAFFDPPWYVERASGAQLSAAVLHHYLEVGTPAGIDPSPKFNLTWYIENNADVAAAGVNPFVHFLHHGRAEGRLPCKPTVYKGGEEVGRTHLQCLKYETPGAEAALFVTHSSDGRLKPHVRRYIEALTSQSIDVFLLVAADGVFQEDAGWVKSTPKALFVRENVGFDFGYWAHILRRYRELYNREVVYLLNDSLFGPVNDYAFAAMVAKVRASSADVVGLTENLDRGWHVQSYFLAIKKRALGSYAFQNFVLGVRNHQDLHDVVNACEIPFAPSMREAGLVVEALYKLGSTRDSTVFHWRELLNEGFPFLKVKVARDDIPGVDKTAWRESLDCLGYDVRLADACLAGFKKVVPGEPPPRGASMTGPGYVEIYPGAPRLAFISPFNFDNGLGVAGRGYAQALMHTSIAHNLLAIRPPFYIHKRVSPSIDRLDFVGAADVAVLQVNPDGWDTLVTSDQKAAFEMARRKVGLFFWESSNLPPEYVNAARKLDAIWVPSSYCADAFRAAGARRVDVIPCVVEPCARNAPKEQRVALRGDLGLAPDERVVLYTFDASSYLIRKNPAALALAFDASGLWREGWRLVLKTKNLEYSPDHEARELAVLVGKIAGVLLVNRAMGAAELRALNSVADIYASSHCSEGFGLTIAEALAAGKTVVATDFGGSRDFLDETVGFPVEAHPFELDRDYGAYKRGVVWARVDEGHFAKRLREAAALSPTARALLGQRASARMAESFSAKAIGARIEGSVADLL
jgi:glycosyltransferase involved in cell wall biosynthesis